MSYQALYRKFRPQTFDEVKGQDAIVTTLKNQIKNERIGHAYLFCGTRGTGKTSIAKLFARSVNCENPQDGSPCGECSLCKKIIAGNSLNVIEMDAASNNGVEDVRQIVEEVTYSPTEGKYKVYIIDEVHMLSLSAFNALLKTIEEPPAYVIFILATTEVHKIPITILSRCQRYDFRRIDIATIVERMKELTEVEGIAVEEKALMYIAKCADGSMRDALSLLDQCVAFYLGQTLTYDNALEVLGAVDTEVFSKMLRCIVSQQIKEAMVVLNDMVMKGRELSQFVTDFAWYLRNLLLVKTEENIEDIIDVSTEHKKLLMEEAQMIETPVLMRFIRIFGELSGQLKLSTQKRVLLEMTIIKLCRPQMENDLSSLIQRIAQLEERLDSGTFVQSAATVSNGEENSVSSQQSAPAMKVPMPEALPEDVEACVKRKSEIIDRISVQMVKSYIKASRFTVENNKLIVVFENPTYYEHMKNEEYSSSFSEAVNEVIDKEVEFEMKLMDGGRNFNEVYPDIESAIHSKINFEIEMEE